jgi:hypothetical protein
LLTHLPIAFSQVLLYEELGIANKMTLILVGVWGTVTLLSTTPEASLFDKMGRRLAYFIAMSIVLVLSIMPAIFWAKLLASGNINKALGNLAIFSIFLFLFGYAFIMNAFGYAYVPEIMPTPIRATGVAISFAIMNGIIIMLVQVTPLGIGTIQWRYFMIFIFIDVIHVVLVYFLFPETNGRPLEE